MCCHGHTEVAPLGEFQEDQQEETQCIFHGKHMGGFLSLFLSLDELGMPFPPGEQAALTLLAKRRKEKCNSVYSGKSKVCLHLLQAHNCVI